MPIPNIDFKVMFQFVHIHSMLFPSIIVLEYKCMNRLAYWVLQDEIKEDKNVNSIL